MLYNVIVEINGIESQFTYQYDSEIAIGTKVTVPFGNANRRIDGFVVSKAIDSNYDVKTILEVSDFTFSVEQQYYINYLSKRNTSPYFKIVNLMLPPHLQSRGKEYEPKLVLYVEYKQDYDGANEKYRLIVERIKNESILFKVASDEYGNAVNTLIKNGYLTKVKKPLARFSARIEKSVNNYNLNIEQRNCYNEVMKHQYNLIHGVTGSGKTLVYLEVIKTMLAQNKNVLILVPEIVLSMQLVNIVASTFNTTLSVFHKSLSSKEQNDQYELITNNQVRIIIGTRSSIFLPIPNLGCIIVDEEHDNAYKQSFDPFYNTIELAYLKARLNDCKLILASATPNVNTYYQALKGSYHLSKLTKPFYNRRIVTKIVDMKKCLDYIISAELIHAIDLCLEKNKQFLIFINRRGYANYMTCANCLEVMTCPNCTSVLTKHLSHYQCHRCNHKQDELVCSCGSKQFIEVGVGTQQVENHLKLLFPQLRIKRVDKDNSIKKDLEASLFEFKDGMVDCLVGTTMIAKGIDVKAVELVGILNADFTLGLKMFSSREQVFDYVAQACGRCGRNNEKSTVIVQINHDDTDLINAAVLENYTDFYNIEIEKRLKEQSLPFAKYAKIEFKATDEVRVLNLATQFYNQNKMLYQMYAPTSNHLYQTNKVYMIYIIVKYEQISQILKLIETLKIYKNKCKASIVIDTNTLEI